MGERKDERPIPELEGLRAPRLSGRDRGRLHERILLVAEPILARRRSPATSWDVLAKWARPGLVAAGVALLVLAGAWQLRSDPEPAAQQVALSDALAVSESGPVPALLLASNEPDADAVVVAALLESQAGRVPSPDEQR
jgi:hypothetical protein